MQLRSIWFLVALVATCNGGGAGSTAAPTGGGSAGSSTAVPQSPGPQPPTPPLASAIEPNAAREAVASTVRVICAKQDSAGSGFVHLSGRVVTAAHVIHPPDHPACDAADVVLILPTGKQVKITKIESDEKLDVALLVPAEKLTGGLKLRSGQIEIGLPVAAWGFPAGYPGLRPLLTMGFIAGEAPIQQNGPMHLWINGAFNSGNSGGPLVLAQTGEVIGIVDTKIAPLPQMVNQAIGMMSQPHSGFGGYTVQKSDGTKQELVEGQVVAMVLDELRKQVQLVIGTAILYGDVAAFMKAHGVTP